MVLIFSCCKHQQIIIFHSRINNIVAKSKCMGVVTNLTTVTFAQWQQHSISRYVSLMNRANNICGMFFFISVVDFSFFVNEDIFYMLDFLCQWMKTVDLIKLSFLNATWCVEVREENGYTIGLATVTCLCCCEKWSMNAQLQNLYDWIVNVLWWQSKKKNSCLINGVFITRLWMGLITAARLMLHSSVSIIFIFFFLPCHKERLTTLFHSYQRSKSRLCSSKVHAVTHA